MKKYIGLVIGTILAFYPLALSAQTYCNDLDELSCSQNGTAIFFINGIFNIDITDATKKSEAIELILSQIKGEIDKTLINSTLNVDTLFNNGDPLQWIDLIESLQLVLKQNYKLDEIQSFNVISALFNDENIERIAPVIKMLTPKEDLSKLEHALEAARSEASNYFVNRMTEAKDSDADEMTKSISRELLSGKKVIVITHPQGSLFFNKIYEKINQQTPHLTPFLKSYHIAPFSSSMEGEACTKQNYYTVTSDRIINTLSIALILSAPPIPAQFDLEREYGVLGCILKINPKNECDPTNHHLIETYLNPKNQISKINSDESLTADDFFKNEIIKIAKTFPANCGCIDSEGNKEEGEIWSNGGGFISKKSLNNLLASGIERKSNLIYMPPSGKICGDTKILFDSEATDSINSPAAIAPLYIAGEVKDSELNIDHGSNPLVNVQDLGVIIGEGSRLINSTIHGSNIHLIDSSEVLSNSEIGNNTWIYSTKIINARTVENIFLIGSQLTGFIDFKNITPGLVNGTINTSSKISYSTLEGNPISSTGHIDIQGSILSGEIHLGINNSSLTEIYSSNIIGNGIKIYGSRQVLSCNINSNVEINNSFIRNISADNSTFTDSEIINDDTNAKSILKDVTITKSSLTLNSGVITNKAISNTSFIVVDSSCTHLLSTAENKNCIASLDFENQCTKSCSE